VNDFFQKINGSGSLNANSKFHDYKVRLRPEKELTVFRVVQELINNILKHSNASFIHLTQHSGEENMLVRIHHDGRGLNHEDFLRLAKSNVGLGLKNVQSRLKVIHGDILYEEDTSQSFFKITLDIPKDIDEK
jgi:signal transduction histidine kinase